MPFFNLNKNGSSHEIKCFNNRCDLEESIAVDSLLNENNESKRAERVLALIALLTLLFVAIEVVGGWLAHSVLVIWVLTGMLLYMAVWRIVANEYEVKPDTVENSNTSTSSSSSDIEEENNSQCSGSNKSNNLNIRAAFVHVLGDLCQSLGMEASPQFVSHDKIYKNLLSLPNVVGIHSLRVWALKSDTLAATVHLELEENSDANKVSIMAQYLLAKIHRIRFSTVQNCYKFRNFP
uniref:Cation efflux protein cytoplasmic domain-containing protein n=1 Tax=Meloidogyne javanica TaxID=6303 RepID=A0A915LFC1_MELJA